jgi:hypothetical protein
LKGELVVWVVWKMWEMGKMEDVEWGKGVADFKMISMNNNQ